MRDRDALMAALGRAGKRASIHLIQAAIEGVKAVESVIDELAAMDDEDGGEKTSETERIEVE